MKLFVLVKQVPDMDAKIKVGADQQIDPTGIKWIMNLYDEYAVEEAVKFKEKNAGTQVYAITLGPKARAADVLRTALAMGADEGILVDSAQNLDHLATAKVLAKVIEQEGGAHMILGGKLSIDDNAASVTQMVAELLKLPHTSVVTKMTAEGANVVVERETDGGSKEVVQMTLPAVIGANKGLNNPRYASLPGIMKAKKKVLKEIAADSLGLNLQARTKVLALELPPEKPAVKMMSGDSAAQVHSLVQLLRDEAKVL